LITDFDDADNECDEYEDCDPFGDYDGGTLAEIDRVEREAFATGKYIYSSYLKFVLTHIAGSSHPQQLHKASHTSSDPVLAISTHVNSPSTATMPTGSQLRPHKSSSANIDPQLLTLEANSASAHPAVPTEQRDSFHGHRNSGCEGGHPALAHVEQTNTARLGSGTRRQAGHAVESSTTRKDAEDEQARLKELREAATRSQTRTFA